jgi:succinate dehydrogenase/fumarate reductase flavoprotein subunit
MGGLQINERAQVLHLDGHPIPGLYAAGELCGGIHGADRLGSCATVDCLTFGRIAGKNVAAEAPCTVHDAEPHVLVL